MWGWQGKWQRRRQDGVGSTGASEWLGSGVVLGALAVGIPGGLVVLAVVVFIIGLLVGGLGGGGVVNIVVESSSLLRVAKEEILALSSSSLSSRAVALRDEVGVFFGGFVDGSAKEEILAWREAEVRGQTSSWFM
jgi:hypothetical protein